MNPSRRKVVTASAATLSWLGSGPARAQPAWPSKPIRFVVGYPAGGLTDGLTRELNISLD